MEDDIGDYGSYTDETENTDYSGMGMSGSAYVWSEKMNSTGFMGFVDKLWIFCKRINTILAIFITILMIIALIAVLCVRMKNGGENGGSESFDSLGTTRMRHSNKKYM